MFQNDAKQMVSYKIMILYLVQSLEQNVQKSTLTDFFLQYDYMNYFEFQQYLTELVETGLMVEVTSPGGDFCVLTDAGINSLSFFMDRLEKSVRVELDWRIEIERSKKLTERKPEGKYVRENENRHFAELKIYSGHTLEFYMKLMVPDQDTAEALISRWYDRYDTMSNEINAWRTIFD